MTAQAHFEVSPALRRIGRQVGYGVAIGINIVLLVVVQNVLDWGWFGFLTQDFAEVAPWISMSIGVSILANIFYIADDRFVVKSLGQMVTNLITFGVSIFVLRVFPFDFSGYDFNWDLVARIVLIVAIVGSAIGAIAELVKLMTKDEEVLSR